MSHDRSQVNTFGLQRAIRDSDELTSTERLILLTITTYYPICCPSRATLARGAGVHRDTLDRTLRTLKRKGALRAVARPGKPSRLVITLPHTTLPQNAGHCTMQDTAYDPTHPTAYDPTKETKKRSINNTSVDTQITAAAPQAQGVFQDHAKETSTERITNNANVDTNNASVDTNSGASPTQAQGAGDKGEGTPQQRLAAWRDVWREVIGDSPLPSLAELRRVSPGLTEAHFSAHLGAVATAKAAGTVRVPRSLFFSRLKESRGEPAPAAWSKEQVRAALAPPLTSPPDLRRPELRRHVVKPKPVVTPEERAKRIAAMRKATAELWGADGAGGDA